MSFGDLVNFTHGSASSGALTINFTTPTLNNLLVAVFSRSTASTAGTPSGWTSISNSSGGNLYGSWFYKIAAGTESTITSADSASGNVTGCVLEVEGPFNTASILDVIATNSTKLSTVTQTLSSGTTATTAQADNFVLAYFAGDSGTNFAAGQTLTNGFEKVSGDTSTGRAYYCLGGKNTTSIGAQETTFATTGTGDEMYGAIAVFKAAGGGGTVYEESVTIGASAGVSDAGNATINTLETLGTILQNSMFENADMLDSTVLSAAVLASINNGISMNQAATLAASVTAAPTNNIGMEASSALATSVATSTNNSANIEALSALDTSVTAAPANNLSVEEISTLSASLSASQTNNANMEDSSTLQTFIATSANNNANMNNIAYVGITAETNGANDYTVNENVSVNIQNDDYQFGNVNLSDTVMIATQAALANDNIAEMGNTITLAVEDVLTASGGTSFGDSITLQAETVLSSGTAVTVETQVVVGLNAETDYGAKVNFEITISLGQHISVLNINQAVMATGLAIAARLAANTAITTGNHVKMKVFFSGMDVEIFIGMS